MVQNQSPLILTRTLRMPLLAHDAASDAGVPAGPYNGLLGGGGDIGINSILEFEIAVAGAPGPSGYLVDITVLDAAVRAAAAGRCATALRAEVTGGARSDVPALLREIARAASASIPAQIRSLTLRPSPFRSTTVEFLDDLRHMPDAMPTTLITETFEFAASHRLHLPELDAHENQRLFGKCNNPNGHGHNYRIEVGCAVEPASSGREGSFRFGDLEEIVQREIMRRFDHKHLNLDCPEFQDLNPSVENIARVCHGLLDAPVRSRHGELRFVRVWETDKTSCRYPA